MKVWVIAENADLARELVGGAKVIAKDAEVTAFVGGTDTAVPAAKVFSMPIPNDRYWGAYLPAIIDKVKAEKPAIILIGNSKRCKDFAGQIAMTLDCPCFSGCESMVIEGDKKTVTRMIYGGLAVRTITTTAPIVVATVAAKTYEPATGAAGAVEALAPAAGLKVTGREPKVSGGVNLAEAAIIVGIGRGFTEQSQTALAEDLAKALGGVTACTRPIAEFFKWMPEERYLGISGQIVKPQLYLAAGVSGQAQHISGVRDSKTIVAVNKDENAPMLEMSDYFIVGDLKEVLPALTAAAKG